VTTQKTPYRTRAAQSPSTPRVEPRTGVQRFRRLEHPAAGPAWLTSILVNLSRDRGRARPRAPEGQFRRVEDFSQADERMMAPKGNDGAPLFLA
jgi:hypothetical protein